MTRLLGDVLVNGDTVAPDEAVISVFDIGLRRGYGCFETIRSYGGSPFRLHRHLDRLERSAAALRMELPDRAALEDWVTRAASVGDSAIRVIVTGGPDEDHLGRDGVAIVTAEELPDHQSMALLPIGAPWHSGGVAYDLTATKSLSYAPNHVATLRAQSEGFDDALLLGRASTILEGPTFSIAWVRDGTIETPTLALGILDSITRNVVLEAAEREDLVAIEGEFGVARLDSAKEVFAMSTVKEVAPVIRVGDTVHTPGPVTARLRKAFHETVYSELESS